MELLPQYGGIVLFKLLYFIDMKQKMRNTKKQGMLEIFVYPEGKQFVGVCLTFNIVDVGKDPRTLLDSLTKAALGHVQVVIKKNLSDDLLNRPAPQEYWDKYEECLVLREMKKMVNKKKSPSTVSLVKQLAY
ncbi:hypothetical protein MYX07_06700 [Patescibacteria group bacterium AH-259-L07]|nr:hypothetical protein [Patescibacteria group bacterium AH-259-L07]